MAKCTQTCTGFEHNALGQFRMDRLEQRLEADVWVQRMIVSPGRPGSLDDHGSRLRYLEWGDSANPRVMLLLHGFLGHAHWWDLVAPSFAQDYRVVAVDFGGMGDSDHRLAYSTASFVGDVEAALAMTGARDVTVVGHSFGGRITLFAARQLPQLIGRAIIVDSKLGFADQPVRPRFFKRPKKSTRIWKPSSDISASCRKNRLSCR